MDNTTQRPEEDKMEVREAKTEEDVCNEIIDALAGYDPLKFFDRFRVRIDEDPYICRRVYPPLE